ncbi:Phenol hydroxylase P1 protein [Methylocella tundrae]|uniref:Phenol hydroxylase P1 protein n=1 Tax=Methylocella tundrae TaxID=227605 RepID=A0A8B6M9F3_METTU|nr:aromatic/alkene monooxygenase hydroxylase subunit beta [Methylocella tundrae]VTZ23439.1 Phenol hydroxylase P1 protein [Methylocella tundrae]VTZ50812.1 Phenol hydroxylase P1 protein [Methylocella tundrae]
MALEIRTSTVRQRRQTFSNVARRLGADKPGSRYEEALYDLQSEVNFHYRPTWDPAHELFDKSRTKISMADWYQLKDPRQLYYGTYTIQRARMMEAVEKNFAFAEKRGLLYSYDPEWREVIRFYLLPLRHVEWGANMNACNMVDKGYGVAITQPAMFAVTDRLGIAQIISRIGLAMGGAGALDEARERWITAPEWQPMRRLVEDTLVIEDWFEQFVAQFLSLDGLLYPLVYGQFDAAGLQHGAGALSMLVEFMVDWQDETAKWVDAVLKRAASESAANRQLIAGWHEEWIERSRAALAPLAQKVLGPAAEEALSSVQAALENRADRLGVRLSTEMAA